jgi:hypothetical protein
MLRPRGKKHSWDKRMHTILNPSNPNHEWFEELCALAAIGELCAAEFQDLQEHLSGCPHCRQLYADFCRISADDIGLVAIQGRAEQDIENGEAPLDEKGLLGRILSRTRHDQAVEARRSNSAPEIEGQSIHFRGLWISRWLRRPAFAYGVLALMLLAVGAAYRFRDVQQNKKLTDLESRLAFWKDRAESKATKENSAVALLEQSRGQQAALQKSLEEARAQYADLVAQRNVLQTAVAAANARAEQLGNDLNVARTTQKDEEGLVGELQAKLERATARLQEQQQLVADLGRKLEKAEATAVPAPPPIEDAEAKNLFGARDLHIVDVYDVASNGKTKRTYGRVYYVEKKLLVFYAFDLEDKRHNRMAAGFQAWGYREANVGKPANLGLFYVDDASLDRWVLKVNNPRVLEHIDAVFVTLEPPAGSPFPKGQRLLYANLSGPPNHP